MAPAERAVARRSLARSASVTVESASTRSLPVRSSTAQVVPAIPRDSTAEAVVCTEPGPGAAVAPVSDTASAVTTSRLTTEAINRGRPMAVRSALITEVSPRTVCGVR